MPEVLQLIHGIFALAQPLRRREALAEFAVLVGARAIVPLVRDPEIDTFLPAAEIGGPLAGGPGWRSLLAVCAEPGTYHGAVAARRGEAEVPALACSTGQAALVILASEVPDELISEIARALPALGATWRTEIEVRALSGTLQAALGTARDTQVMAEALDRTRDDLESKARSLFNACTRAEEASRVKDEFLAVLGHELRNPLAPIVTALELMRLDGKPTREQIIIERHVTQMRRMVDDLLDVARTTRGRLKIQRVHLELSDAIAQGIEMASPLLEAREQIFSLEMPDELLNVDGDQGRLAQVVANLLTNASRYSDPGSTIKLIAEGDEGTVRLRVIDQGIGIDPIFLPDIFEPFSQGHRKAREGGTDLGLGLGLGIVKTLVGLHNGSVRAESRGRNLGSEFIVELPRGKRTLSLTPPPPPVTSGAATGTRVLIVDDNSDIAELMADILARRGYTTEVAYDGPSALSMASKFEPAIGLLDLGLPVMDGYELAKRLLANPLHQDMKLVAVTGYGQPEDYERSMVHGFRAHLVKPVDINTLSELLGDLANSG